MADQTIFGTKTADADPGLRPVLSVSAWATRRDGKLRTTGILGLDGSLNPSDTKTALKLGLAFEPKFDGAPAATGKVILLNPECSRVGVYQLLGVTVESVRCGNALAAAAACQSHILATPYVHIVAEHLGTLMQVNANVSISGSIFVVDQIWEIEVGSVSVTRHEGSVVVRGLNDFEIRVVDEFPVEPVTGSSCGEKFLYIKRTDRPAEVKLSTCGKWHGALSQTGAAALALARTLEPSIAEVLTDTHVAHPQGIDRLPKCTLYEKHISIEIPEVAVGFRLPTY